MFHPGCNKNTLKGLDSLILLLKYCLENTKSVNIVIENMTKTNTLCQSWKDIKYVLDKINNKRIGVCLDTAHCWGAGKKKNMNFDTLLNDFNTIIGLKHLKESFILTIQKKDLVIIKIDMRIY